MFTELGFSKKEHLCAKKRVDQLFSKGKGFIVYPFRVVYNIVEEDSEYPLSLLISVPKRNFKRANKRNKIKRHIRESFRLQKIPLYTLLQEKNVHLDMAILYLDKEIKDATFFLQKMEEALTKLKDRLV